MVRLPAPQVPEGRQCSHGVLRKAVARPFPLRASRQSRRAERSWKMQNSRHSLNSDRSLKWSQHSTQRATTGNGKQRRQESKRTRFRLKCEAAGTQPGQRERNQTNLEYYCAQADRRSAFIGELNRTRRARTRSNRAPRLVHAVAVPAWNERAKKSAALLEYCSQFYFV